MAFQKGAENAHNLTTDTSNCEAEEEHWLKYSFICLLCLWNMLLVVTAAFELIGQMKPRVPQQLCEGACLQQREANCPDLDICVWSETC